MKLPTSYLSGKPRSAVRFMVIGFSGSVIQTMLFLGALALLGNPEKGLVLYYVAFAIGYVLEMIPNYLFTNWYTFGTRPNMKNAGGFLAARAVNLVIQLGLLPIFVEAFPTWRNDIISYVVIFIGGCINYLVCLIFFKNNNHENLQS